MKKVRWIEQSRLLALLALVFALVPAGLAVRTYRDGLRKDALVYQTTMKVLAEQLLRSFERHTYLPRDVRQQARNLDEAGLLAGKMVPAFPWQQRLPHLLAMGYARRESGQLILRWLSDQRSPVAALGDDLLQQRGVADALKAAPPNDPFVTLGCMVDPKLMLVLLTIPGTSPASDSRGYIVAWIDLESLCGDHELELIRDDVLSAAPQATMQASSDIESFVPIGDGAATWVVRIRRGAGFDKYGAPTPWLTFIAVGLSTLPLLLLASLAARSARLSASLEAEREVLRQQRFFTQSVSHEFRTPLGIIQSGADLLDQYAEHLTPERRREVLDEIRDNTHQMTAMVEQVLFLGRMESGGTACQRKPVSLAAICEEAAQRMTKAAGRDRSIEVRVPQCEVMLDPLLIGSLLENVLGNAVKYSHPDKLVTLEAAADDERMTIVVRDEGMGIPASELPRVCDPFHRCGNVGDAPGTGLGLAIASRCAALHGGVLNIESVEGKGTTVTITIPTSAAS